LPPFSELNIEDAYDSGTADSNVLKDFYVPVMSEAVRYDRLTGYFSSTILSLAARGVAGLVRNGGTMRLVSSPQFTEQDIEVLSSNPSEVEIDNLISDRFRDLVADLEGLTEFIAKDHLRAFAWMLREGYLEVRILVPRDFDGRAGIFHSKVGILTDSEGNQLSFSGSVNETAAAWKHNIEEFKVFRSWEPEGAKWVRHDQGQFERYWKPSGDMPYISRPLPDKIRESLVAVAPDDFESLELEEPESIASLPVGPPPLRDYQTEAVEAWISAGMQGILEMATGTGKTRTALECISRFQNGSDRSLTVVTAPFQHIATQWRQILGDMDPVCSFDSGSWKSNFRNSLTHLKTFQRDHLVWVVVQNTASSKEFLELLESAKKTVGSLLLVGDEAHGLGARVFSKALSPVYSARLGLTATPTRWFDEVGSKSLQDFFHGAVYEFSLSKALRWVDPQTGETPLAPYTYHPEFIDLSDEELEEFASLTQQIVSEAARSTSDEPSERLELLLFRRAGLVKTAEYKIPGFESLVKSLPDMVGTLVYCHNEQQMGEVISIVSRTRYRYRRFTGSEGTSPRPEFNGLSEREWILESFSQGEIDVLVAMKCLDEGVDVPSAKRGIILASSGNPREFIQRRGRLLRRYPGKEKAEIHDLVVVPKFGKGVPVDASNSARAIISKELERIEEFSRDALNSEIINTKVLSKLVEMGFVQ
jgi:superfamily II DNA or RNA helicase